MTKCIEPQPWSEPLAFEVRVRPKSEAVKLVTLSAAPISTSASWKARIAAPRRIIRVGWVVSTLSWVSKPPRLTKKTCRLAPNSCDTEIRRATMRSWSASVLLAGNGVAIAGPAARAPLTWAWRSNERFETRACSSSNRFVRGAVISARRVLIPVAAPNRGEAFFRSGTGPVEVTAYWAAARPERKTLLPDALMQVRVAVPLPDWRRSPMRPPQPDVAPSGFDACQKLC